MAGCSSDTGAGQEENGQGDANDADVVKVGLNYELSVMLLPMDRD